jgi:sugar phosphate isomerase/epimerase
MTPRVGFDHYTIAHRDLDATETLDFAQTHGLDGVQFLDPSEIDRELDRGRLAAFRQQADDMGLYLEVGLPSPNPIRRSREVGRSVSAREHADDLASQLDAVVALGCRYARVYVGDRHDRFRADLPWGFQLDATFEVLSLLSPGLMQREIRLAVETHADLTVPEMASLLERLDPRAFGVTMDTGNLLMRLENPLEAAARLAPWVLGTHIKDAVLAFTPRGLCWQARPVGSGILPIPDLLALLIQANPHLHLTIELHPRTYDLPIFDRKWLAFFPSLTPDALASVVRLATLCEEQYAQGTLPRPEAVERIPWASRDLDWLASSLGYLRSVAPTLARL